MNCRRPTGFDSSVSAVRPSISSAIDTLAVHRARMIDNTMIKVRPFVLDHLDVFAQRVVGNEGEEDQAEDADRQQHVEQRLRHGLLGGGSRRWRPPSAQAAAASRPISQQRGHGDHQPRRPPATAASTRSTTFRTGPDDLRPR